MQALRAIVAALAALGCHAALAGAAATGPADTMAQRLQACTGCHGKEGRATQDGYFPRIAGKPAGYLYNQLVNFREGRRHNAAMAYLLEHMSDDYLREIAAYFAGLDLPYPPAQTQGASERLLRRGAELVRHGDARRGIPACSACHGVRMTGVQPAMPGLVGLPRDYLAAQLGAWKSGQRQAAAPDCMAHIAGRLSTEDVSAIVTWLSAQPPPADARPAQRLEGEAPLECGSGMR